MELAIEARDHELLAEANRQAAQRERQLEESTASLLEAKRNRNDTGHTALYELLVVSFSCILAKSCTSCLLDFTVGCVYCKLKFPTRRTTKNMLREMDHRSLPLDEHCHAVEVELR